MKPDEHDYCTECRSGKYSFEVKQGVCEDCGTEIQSEWPTAAWAKNRVKSWVALLAGGLIVFGPWLAAVYVIVKALLDGKPLIGWKTVEVTKTVTRPTGVVNEAVPLVIIGVFVWVVVAFMMYGPRMR